MEVPTETNTQKDAFDTEVQTQKLQGSDVNND